jgi:hypothetical protein
MVQKSGGLIDGEKPVLVKFSCLQEKMKDFEKRSWLENL